MTKDDTDAILHTNLVSWIIQNGGSIHKNLALHTPTPTRQDTITEDFTHRGIFAKHGVISKGEELIRLPCKLALDGSKLSSSYTTNLHCSTADFDDDERQLSTSTQQQQRRTASPWLRCLASLMNAMQNKEVKDNSFYNPYLESLPVGCDNYDSILNWSEGEIKYLLAGTALQDACTSEGGPDKALHERYVKSVVPYLQFLTDSDGNDAKRQKINNDTKQTTTDDLEHLYPLFRESCMCISTRAFHMQLPPTAAEGKTAAATANNIDNIYQGPYLLPYIDLLNHASKGSSKHVTTLTRDTDGSFVMIAERDIAIDEEICHSYDSSGSSTNQSNGELLSKLNSAQLMQTFGFVPVDDICKDLLTYYQDMDRQNQSGGASSPALNNITPAVLTKKQVSNACKELVESSYPDKLNQLMEQTGMLDEGWESWKMPTLDDMRENLLLSYSDEIIIPFGVGQLSDELITICCVHFLPDEAITDLIGDDDTTEAGEDQQQQSLLLGSEVLEDFYLGKLVLQAILNALKEKLSTYKVSSSDLDEECKRSEKLCSLSSRLLYLYHKSDDPFSFCYGKDGKQDVAVLTKLPSLARGNDLFPEVVSNSLPGVANTIQKFRCGMIISLEERACLLELKTKVIGKLELIDLDGGE